MADTTVPLGTPLTPHEQSEFTMRPFAGTAATYYPGQLISLNSSGYCVNGGDTASTTFAGVFAEPINRTIPSGGSNGDYSFRIARPRYVRIKHTGLALADEGALATISDNQTVSKASVTTNDIVCGRIHRYLSSTEVVIEVLPFGQGV